MEPPAETPELARIATHLRRDDEPAPLRERPEGFDVNAILDAVREVAGVRDAALRRTPAGAHSLRLDLADGADPAEVSRQVARLLQERMGLAAAPQNLPGLPGRTPPPVAAWAAARPSGDRSRNAARRCPAGPVRRAADAPVTAAVGPRPPGRSSGADSDRRPRRAGRPPRPAAVPPGATRGRAVVRTEPGRGR